MEGLWSARLPPRKEYEGGEKKRHTIIEYRIADAVDGLIIVGLEAIGRW